MGYACPVCGDPQADAGHLANHLAFTAMIRGGDHESWLDERVPGWGDLGEAELGERLRDLAEEADYPQVFEDTTDAGSHAGTDEGGTPGDASTADGRDLPPGAGRLASNATGEQDERTREILDEARDLTERRREDSETE